MTLKQEQLILKICNVCCLNPPRKDLTVKQASKWIKENLEDYFEEMKEFRRYTAYTGIKLI